MISLYRIQTCLGPDGCGRERAVIWQGDCGCWTFKCLICGNVDAARCGDEHEDHWNDFEVDCVEITG